MNGKGWFFIKLDELKHGEKDHSITKIKTLEINRLLDNILIYDKNEFAEIENTAIDRINDV